MTDRARVSAARAAAPYLGLLLTLLLAVGMLTPAKAAPQGFTDEPLPGLEALTQPTAFAFLPDGTMLIATKPGLLLRYAGGALSATPVLDIRNRVCTSVEMGLLGVAVDPDYNPSVAASRHIYVYYSTGPAQGGSSVNCGGQGRTNRVSRFTIGSNGVATNETILIDQIGAPGAAHNAGDLHFGKDGNLYVSVGDGAYDTVTGTGGGSVQEARRLYHLRGKILRITRAGGIPAGNPYTGAGTARCYDPAPGGNKTGQVAANLICQEIFAWGLRNPFRIAFDPNAAGTRFFINDVGQDRMEEINEGRAGADYGWNCFEGTDSYSTSGLCAPPINPEPPVFAYTRSLSSCGSITGGAFVPNGVWPSAYDDAYLFADYNCGRIFTLARDGSGQLGATEFANLRLINPGAAATHMAFGPYQGTRALYYADFFGGTIRRIRYSGDANRSPLAAATATPRAGALPLTVSFDASASSDPDGDAISAYLWDFGDGKTAQTTGPTTSHTYTTDGVFTATLRVRDSRGATSANTVRLRIDAGNTPPQPQILTPADGATFVTGQAITLSGSATDAEDGPLGPASLSWEVRRHHADHFHPYHSADGVVTTQIVAPGPEDLAAVDNSYLEVRLTATDSLGSSTVITRAIRPRIVNLSFATEPPGLKLIVDGGTVGNTIATPAVVRSWPGFVLRLGAPRGQTVDGVAMCLTGWRHSAGARTLLTPATDAAYTALFGPEDEGCLAERMYLPVIHAGPR
ncbi:MAG TPA: PQQ-dependent sugar dehydrogenase [Chloroflexaceae bacterium]|nr:PQQ-dependent sugar dehydrogenase [Chloroflexaceae bacterium]